MRTETEGYLNSACTVTRMNLTQVLKRILQSMLPQKKTLPQQLILLQAAIAKYLQFVEGECLHLLTRLPADRQTSTQALLYVNKIKETETMLRNTPVTLADPQGILTAQASELTQIITRHRETLTVYCEQTHGIFTSDVLVKATGEKLAEELKKTQQAFYFAITRQPN